MLVLGTNANHKNPESPNAHVRQVYLSDDARKQGTYVIGTTGTGKTTFLLNLIHQDMKRQGPMGYEGLCVLDPHGDFTVDILQRVPKERWDDVVLLDPADTEYPFGLNLFDCNKSDARERDLVVSTVIDTLYKLFEYSWGPRMEDLLRHSILTLLYYPEPTTLIDLMLLLVSQEHRQRLIEPAKARDPIIRSFWEEQFGRYTTREQVEVVGSSLNKIGRFIANPIIRHIIGQPRSSFNLRSIMDEGKILLVNLSKGDLGQDNSTLLGAVLVNQLLIAALSRRDIREGERRPFHLYVDEYQTFATKTFPQLQSEARKYAIDTLVAHQYREQLDDENRGSTLNVANLVSFRVSGKDAVELAGQFDLLPGEGEPRLAPHPVPLDDYERFYIHDQLPSGQTIYERLEGIPRPYSDTLLETANMLSQLPNYQAICRVLTAKSWPRTLHQFRIDLTDKPAVSAAQAQKAEQHIRGKAREMAQFTREEIAAYIAEATRSDKGDNTGLIPEFETL